MKNIQLTPDERIFIIASLLVSLDKVSNTTGVYCSYLKTFKKQALKVFELKPIHTRQNLSGNKVFNKNIMNIADTEVDVAYLDPPYNWRQYGSNYGLLNAVANETTMEPGVYNRSVFCQKNAETEFANLVNKLNAKYIVLSYSSEGKVPINELIEILETRGAVTLYRIKHERYHSKCTEIKTVYEYLLLCQCEKNKQTKYFELY